MLRRQDTYYRQNGKQYTEPEVREYQEALESLEEERWLQKMPKHVRERRRRQPGGA
jgi:hypothetical protein